MESTQPHELVVIGAGLSGIAFARFYLDTHPTARLAILEKDTCVGGVWSSSRVFDEFWSQSGQRISGFSDVPFQVPPGAPTAYDMYEAKYVTNYLESYLDTHVYNGQSLRDRICFGQDVQAIEKNHDTWIITARDPNDVSTTIRCHALGIASGLTSLPKIPTLPGQERFTKPVLHHRDFARISPRILADPGCTNVTVLGGGKSAADMVYVSVKSGKKVIWVIPQKGKGPAKFMDPSANEPYKSAVEAGITRGATAMNPSCFAEMPLWARILHWTPLGGYITRRKAYANDQRCRAFADYHHRQGAQPTFHKLETQTSFFWSNGPLGLVIGDFWDTIARNVHVERSDVKCIEPSTIILEDGSEVASDALFLGTGWKSHYPFFSQHHAYALGLPCDPEMQPAEERGTWQMLTKQADKQILGEFPMLASPPPPGTVEGRLTPARLYNGIASLYDSSIVFLGRTHISNAFRRAEAQAIWATAYLDGSVTLPTPEEAKREVAYMNAFSKWRYPAFGSDGLYFFNDLLGYTDKLLRDVGLSSHRKDWWTDNNKPCLASDFRDVKDEYLSLYF